MIPGQGWGSALDAGKVSDAAEFGGCYERPLVLLVVPSCPSPTEGSRWCDPSRAAMPRDSISATTSSATEYTARDSDSTSRNACTAASSIARRLSRHPDIDCTDSLTPSLTPSF